MDTSLLSKEELDAIFRTTVGSFLEPMGFVEVTARKWVCDQFKPIRHVFSVQAMKGGSYVYVWGLSLDYVPHVKGSDLAWHKTNRSSIFDLRFDPVDHFKNYTDWYIGSLRGVETARKEATAQLRKAWPIAAQFFQSAQRTNQLLELFTKQMSAQTFRFRFHNYIQQPLAYLVTLAKSGDVEGAMRLLDIYASDYGVPASAKAKICEIVAAA